MLVIADYGMGNLHSVTKGLQRVGAQVQVSEHPEDLLHADKVVLPGVGACDDAAIRLEETGMADAVRQAIAKGTPVLGICLGMQLLFQESEEGKEAGLAIFPEEIKLFRLELKVPHMGWNIVEPVKGCPLFQGMDAFYAYFVHSYYAPYRQSYAAARTEYGVPFASAVWKDNVYATQFHPEKSGEMGLKILENFSKI